jgi:pilus assembly protein CpaE
MTNQSPIKVFITGAANGLAEVREGLADHPDVELVGTAADPVKAGAKLAESAAQVILHGTTATEHVPTTEVEAIRAVTAAPIVLVTSASANSLLSEALQAGVHDVVLLPQLTDGIVFTIKKAHSLAAGRTGPVSGKTASHAEGKVVTLFSPKGGAGKSALACNLAVLFARKHQRRTLLLDLDLQFGDVASALGIAPEATFADATRSLDKLDATTLKANLAAHSSGLYVLCAPLTPTEADDVTTEQIDKVINLLIESFKYVVIDTGSGLDEHTLAALEFATDLILISATDIPSIRSTQKEIDALRMIGKPEQRWHFVLNRADARTGLTIAAIETAIGINVDVAIPSSRAVPLSLNRGMPVIESDPRAPVSLAMSQLVRRIAPTTDRANSFKNGTTFWRKSR